MYSNTEKRNKAKNGTNIFDLAQKVQQQIEGREEALLIMNAYRKVEDINVGSSNLNNKVKKTKQKAQQIHKPESEYANKVKQTLKQLNANRKKEIQGSRQHSKPVIDEKNRNIGAAQRHLVQSGIRRVIKIVEKKYNNNMKLGLQQIIKAGSQINYKNDQIIRLWKLKRLLSGWRYETMLAKIEKQKQAKCLKQKQKRLMKLAEDFNYFCSIKKFFKGWNYYVCKQLKKRQFEFEQNLKRQQQIKIILEEKNNIVESDRKKEIKPNVELQNKLKGFIDGLKDQINTKERLNTVKQKSEEQQQNKQHSELGNHENQAVQENIQNMQNQINGGNNQDIEVAEQNEHHGPLTNQDLEKRRKELQKKAKQRKQALQKLKKDREKKRKQEQQSKQALQKQIEEQQKKVRQEQYRKFLKQKKEEEEWKMREKQLQRQAQQFNKLRLMKFYGWIFWAQLKTTNLQGAKFMGSLLQNIFGKRILKKLVEGILQKGEANLKIAEEKMLILNARKLKKRCLIKLKQWKHEQQQLKQQLKIRNEVNILKIYFKEWQRCRNQIQLENYQWERPRIKRSECLHAMTLLNKAFQSLKINRDEEIQNRNVEQHKAKIKAKFHKIVEEKPTINYDDFL